MSTRENKTENIRESERQYQKSEASTRDRKSGRQRVSERERDNTSQKE